MKTTNLKFWMAVALLVFLGNDRIAAQLQMPVPSLPTKDALVFTADGKQYNGKVTSSFIMNGQLKSFTIKDAEGNKHSFKAAEVLEVRAQMTGMEKLAVVSEKYGSDRGLGITKEGSTYVVDGATIAANVASIQNAMKDDIWKKDLTIYYQVEMKPGKFSLMQILNPGTNSVISVFPAENNRGTDEQFYYAVKGKQITKVDHKSYAKEVYAQLFGDCEAFMSKFPLDKKTSADDFPVHVMKYNELCTKQ